MIAGVGTPTAAKTEEAQTTEIIRIFYKRHLI